MTTVPPGDETGLYYIVIANLAWNCSWQRLKDFARNQQPDGSSVNVETALIYQNTTNGWVSIRGREHFLSAMVHLNGGIFEGRALMADGRNETQSLHLPDISNSRAVLSTSSAGPLSRRHRNDSSSSVTSYQYQTSPSFSEYGGQEGSTEYYSSQRVAPTYSPVPPFFPPVSYFQQLTPTNDNTQYAVQQPVDYFSLASPTGGVVYAGNMVPSTPIYVSTPVYTYAVPISYGETLISPPSTVISSRHTPSSTPVVKTEARKIIITQLPFSTSAAELTEYLIKTISKSHPEGKLSSSASYQMIQELDLAAHSDGKPKGHAFAVFETHHIAKRVINAVDGHQYNGKILNARFAKEGAEPAKRHSSKGSADTHLISPPPDRRQPPATPSSSSNRSSGRSSKSSKDEKNRDGRRLAPTEIRDHEYYEEPTPASGSRSSKGNEPSRHRAKSEDLPKQRRTSWSSTPVVADGSSSSRGKDGKARKTRS